MEIEGTPRALAFFLFVDLAKVGGLRKSMNLRGQRKGGKKEKRSCRLKHTPGNKKLMFFVLVKINLARKVIEEAIIIFQSEQHNRLNLNHSFFAVPALVSFLACLPHVSALPQPPAVPIVPPDENSVKFFGLQGFLISTASSMRPLNVVRVLICRGVVRSAEKISEIQT